MRAFVHIIMLACGWQEDAYVAFQSTENQYDMEVHIKKAKNLKKARTDKTKKWAKQAYTMPWTEILFWLWYDPTGFEICLFSNDFQWETGITIAYRFLKNKTNWHYAKAVVPGMDKWSMQTSFLTWGTNMQAYARNKTRWNDWGSGDLPYFYPPKNKVTEDVLKWAEQHANNNAYAHFMPFIRHVISIYGDTRWKKL